MNPNRWCAAVLLLLLALLPTASVPAADPDFPLAAGPSGPTSLAGIGGARRKLVVFSPEGPVLGIAGMKWNAMKQGLTNPLLTEGLKQRDTVIILATRAEIELVPGTEALRVPADAIEQARQACGVKKGPPAFVLIGKDGGIKSTWTSAVEHEVIFAAIDAMVMRREEMKAAESGRK